MNYTIKEQKALAWYMSQNSCVLQLSRKPVMRFINVNTSELTDVVLLDIVNAYISFRKNESRNNARLKRLR